MQDIAAQLKRQRVFFRSGRPHKVSFRLDALRKLRQAIIANERQICAALADDLGKPELESIVSEIALVTREIDFICRNLKRWAKPLQVGTSLLNFPAKGLVRHEPLGVALIIGPWNYPCQLILSPLVGALAAGNCALVKPSEVAPHTSDVICRMLSELFPDEYVTVMPGGPEIAKALLDERFDIIFFTGSTLVGRQVMQAAARHLTPVILELGGKSPAIVDDDADLDTAARRIVWGKFFNAGQTCVAPDYLLVHDNVKQALLDRMTARITACFGTEPRQSPDFARIINTTHFDRLAGYLADGRVVAGGDLDRDARYLAPTILDGISWQSPIMQEEIFGPILPVLSFGAQEDVLELIGRRPAPLALYYFSQDADKQRRIMTAGTFGGGCINDTVIHLTEHHLPFGGVGPSGQGRYHGRASFEAFSYRKSVLKRGTWFDLPLRYPPYAGKLNILKTLFKWF